MKMKHFKYRGVEIFELESSPENVVAKFRFQKNHQAQFYAAFSHATFEVPKERNIYLKRYIDKVLSKPIKYIGKMSNE